MADIADHASAAITVKIDFGGDIRRLRHWPSDGAAATFDTLQRDIEALFAQPVAGAGLAYRDDEGDICTLCEATLTDALELARTMGKGVLKLTAMPATTLGKDGGEATGIVAGMEQLDAPSAAAPPPAAQHEVGATSLGAAPSPVALGQVGISTGVVADPPRSELAQPLLATQLALDSPPTQEHVEQQLQSPSPAGASQHQQQIDEQEHPRQQQEEQFERRGQQQLQQPPVSWPSGPEGGFGSSSRSGRSQPRWANSFRRFKEQVQEDFRGARADMLDAFAPAPRASAATGAAAVVTADEGGSNASTPASVAPEPSCHAGAAAGAAAAATGALGVVAGLAVSMRLAPIRATLLAAEGLTGAAPRQDGFDAHATAHDAIGATAGDDMRGPGAPAAAAPEVVGETPSGVASPSEAHDGGRGVDSDVQHFKQQVLQDFETAQQQFREVIGCFTGDARGDGQRPRSEGETSGGPCRGQAIKRVVATVAPAVMGSMVAVQLAPIRAVRLAVAATRSAAAGTDTSGANVVAGSGGSSTAAAAEQSSELPPPPSSAAAAEAQP